MLLLAVDLLHLMEPQLVLVDLLGSLLVGGVVDSIALCRAVLEGEAALGRWLQLGSCQDWRLLWWVFVKLLSDVMYIDLILLFNSL